MFVPLLLALTIDGQAALAHASRLAALGPHPWGSPLAQGAAQYVEAQMKDAGLAEVHLAPFEKGGTAGANVVGLRPGPGHEMILVAAHHDSAPHAPGAYDDGGGVGILIEVARALAHAPRPTRTILFVSFDGEEGWSREVPLAGSRAFVESLGPKARDIVGMIAVEMSGYGKGTPTLHPIPYPDPLRPGEYVVTPSWLVREALRGAQAAVPQTALGDPYISWLYQPLVRFAQVRLYGDDRSFLERGTPGIMVSDSSFSAFYPWYHSENDTADRLDAAALGRTGSAVLGMTQALEVAKAERPETDWWAAGGVLAGRHLLLALGLLSLLPGLWAARRGGMMPLALRMIYSGGFGVLLWRMPVPVLFGFLLSNVLRPFASRLWLRIAALLPLIAVIVLGLAAWNRGMIGGLWLRAWELAVVGVLVFFSLAPLPAPPRPRAGRNAVRSPGRGTGGRSGRRGLPKK